MASLFLSLSLSPPLSPRTFTFRSSQFSSVHVSKFTNSKTLKILPCGKPRSPSRQVIAPYSTSVSASLASPATWETLERCVQDFDDVTSHMTSPGVTLYRDTNAWCPFCQRVWLALEEMGIPYSTELINLGNKPKWFLEMVPTGLVPAMKIDGDVTCESLDILWALEKKFPQNALIAVDNRAEIEELLKVLSELSSNTTVFKLIGNTDPDKEEELRSATLEVLDNFGNIFKKYSNEGPFLLGSTLSLADCAYINPLEGINYRLNYFKNISIRGNFRFPLMSKWFDALDQRESYQKVKMDSRSANLVLNYFRERSIKDGKTPSFPEIPFIHSGFPSSGFIDTKNGSFLAAKKIISNRKVIIEFCLRSEKVQKVLKSTGSTKEETVDGTNSEEKVLGFSEKDEKVVDLIIRVFAMALLGETPKAKNIENTETNEINEQREIKIGENEILFTKYGKEELQNSVEKIDFLSENGVQIALASLEHLLEKISVPRDMKIGAKEKFVEIGFILTDILSKKISKKDVVFA